MCASLMFSLLSFQSTLPARGATILGCESKERSNYFNPRSPHGERRDFFRRFTMQQAFQSTLPARGATFSDSSVLKSSVFQSTLPARGATCWVSPFESRSASNFNPRSPHGERPAGSARSRAEAQAISIHAPRTGSDDSFDDYSVTRVSFQSTLPARGATVEPPPATSRCTISIHAPRTGSDKSSVNLSSPSKRFQSTLPARGATPTEYY